MVRIGKQISARHFATSVHSAVALVCIPPISPPVTKMASVLVLIESPHRGLRVKASLEAVGVVVGATLAGKDIASPGFALRIPGCRPSQDCPGGTCTCLLRSDSQERAGVSTKVARLFAGWARDWQQLGAVLLSACGNNNSKHHQRPSEFSTLQHRPSRSRIDRKNIAIPTTPPNPSLSRRYHRVEPSLNI